MSLRDPALRIILYEGIGAETLDAADSLAIVTSLLERGYAITRSTDGRLHERADGSPLLIVGNFTGPPPVVAENGASVRFHNLARSAPSQLGDVIETARAEAAATRHGEWKPWFPVIDYDRCTNCMQCLSFCLFGVYGVDGEKQIQVQNNDNCKTNCPACSRVCPEAAIMFPKYKAGPINGDVVSDADLQKEKMKVDISALLGGDIYEMLRLRSEKARSRFSKERDADKALAERQKCLIKLADAGEIPPEVLMSLPSPEEIARRAQEAAAKAQAALQPRP
jgi:Pyruvate/2-oxoacid:ferredoxin oxidoreductase delta subunit